MVNVVPSACARLSAGAGLAALALSSATVAGAEEAGSTEIVVTAAGFEQKITDAPASISVVGAAELKQRPYMTLIDAVRELEGVDVGETSDKTGQRTISMRGMGPDYTLILDADGQIDAVRGVSSDGAVATLRLQWAQLVGAGSRSPQIHLLSSTLPC